MKKTFLIVSALVLGTGALLVSTPNVFAYRGDASVTGPNYTPERHEKMEKVLENKDFSSWKELMQGMGRVTTIVNEQNFNRFAEMHQLREEGKINEANQIRQELGLGINKGMGRGYNR